jgi:hypothetical protein
MNNHDGEVLVCSYRWCYACLGSNHEIHAYEMSYYIMNPAIIERNLHYQDTFGQGRGCVITSGEWANHVDRGKPSTVVVVATECLNQLHGPLCRSICGGHHKWTTNYSGVYIVGDFLLHW